MLAPAQFVMALSGKSLSTNILKGLPDSIKLLEQSPAKIVGGNTSFQRRSDLLSTIGKTSLVSINIAAKAVKIRCILTSAFTVMMFIKLTQEINHGSTYGSNR